MPITNQIFEHFRAKEKEIEKAKKLLLINGYSIKKIKDETDK